MRILADGTRLFADRGLGASPGTEFEDKSNERPGAATVSQGRDRSSRRSVSGAGSSLTACDELSSSARLMMGLSAFKERWG